MELIITVTEVDKSISNNTLSSWTAAGDVPIGWDSRNVKAVEGGNFGYLCHFLDNTAYIKQTLYLTQGRYTIHFNFNGNIQIGYTISGSYQYNIYSGTTEINKFEFRSITFDVVDDNFGIRIQMPLINLGAYLDFVSVLPENFPAGLNQSFINTKNILNIDTLSRYIENDLFSFVSDSITLSIFDDGNSSYTIIKDMLQSGKLFRLNVGYNNGVKWYYLILFCDPSTISKTTENGRSIYNIEAFELASYFKVNGWFLGNLVSELEDVTGEILEQNYYFLVENYNTIEEIIQAGIDEAKKFFIAESVPISSISKDVTVYEKLINSTFNFIGRIVDVWYNEDRDRTFIIVATDENQILYEVRYNSLSQIATKPYTYFTRFVDPVDKVVATVSMVGVDVGSGIDEEVWQMPVSTYSLYSVYWDYNETGELQARSIYNNHVSYDGNTVFRFGATFDSDNNFNPSVSSENQLPWDRFTANVSGISNSYSFNFQSDIYRIRTFDRANELIDDIYVPGSIINGLNKTTIDATLSLLPVGLSDYKLSNKTFIDMLKDLSVIQNAFFYFNYEISSSNMQIVFQTRAYETATSQLTLDLNNASKYEETYDYIDYSDFETETFKDIVSMKRSLLAYFRNFYGNGLKIIKLTMNELLDISLGDIVTVEGNKYIIRSLETDIGYKDMTGMIQTPRMYLELMEVLLT